MWIMICILARLITLRNKLFSILFFYPSYMAFIWAFKLAFKLVDYISERGSVSRLNIPAAFHHLEVIRKIMKNIKSVSTLSPWWHLWNHSCWLWESERFQAGIDWPAEDPCTEDPIHPFSLTCCIPWWEKWITYKLISVGKKTSKESTHSNSFFNLSL